MDQNINLNNKIYSDNNDISLEIINDLNRIKNNLKDDLIIKTLEIIISKINNIINENKKNSQLKIIDINKSDHIFDNLIFDLKNRQELQFLQGNNQSKVASGLKQGKGIWYGSEEPYIGDWYEGDFKNDKFDGKGIYYFKNGERYEGDCRNGKKEGKGIFYFKSGNRYEGDFKNDKREGNGVMYYQNGDREMGNYKNDKKVGMHVILSKDGKTEIKNYDENGKEIIIEEKKEEIINNENENYKNEEINNNEEINTTENK